MHTGPVQVEYKYVEERNPDNSRWQVIVYEACTEFDQRTQKHFTYKKVIDIREARDIATLDEYIDDVYSNVQEQLDLNPVQSALF